MTLPREQKYFILRTKPKIFEEIFEKLLTHFGPQGWWPGETPFEVCVGAILTQNTNWKNVERAIQNLKEKGLLSPWELSQIPLRALAELIKPCGFYNLKAKRLKNFLEVLIEHYQGDLQKMEAEEREILREKLLQIKGLGKETVDSILLYALNKPIFVVDAYTHRIFSRHKIIPEIATYDEIQELFHQNLKEDVALFKEYHALIVACGKNYCKKNTPQCSACPLNVFFS